MAFTLVSWNIRTLGDRDTQLMGGCVNAAAAIVDQLYRLMLEVPGGGTLPDAILIMEVGRGAGGALGVDAIARRLPVRHPDPNDPNVPTTFLSVLSEANALPPQRTRADRYALVYDPTTVAYTDWEFPTACVTGGHVGFPDRYPARFTVETESTPAVDLVILHGPNPTHYEDASVALRTLPMLACVAGATRPTIVCGDFNVDQITHGSDYQDFTAIGWQPLLSGRRTSLKLGAYPAYRVSAYDNMMVPTAWVPPNGSTVVKASEYDFIAATARQAGYPPTDVAAWNQVLNDMFYRVSDHLPVWSLLQL